MTKAKKAIFLFDVDGTLTKPRQKILPETLDFLKELKESVPLGVVGGSDIGKIFEQLGSDKDTILSLFDFVFAENGLDGFHGKKPLPVGSIKDQLGNEKLQSLINFCLGHMATITLPTKTGNFIESRKGMINVSPIGRSCTQAERDAFVVYETTVDPVRKKFIEELEKKFGGDGLTFSIGGQISIDIFPTGWDKTYCLKYLEEDYDVIHFFGDKTSPGGNDYEIFAHPSTIGHTVTSPADTCEQAKKILLEL